MLNTVYSIHSLSSPLSHALESYEQLAVHCQQSQIVVAETCRFYNKHEQLGSHSLLTVSTSDMMKVCTMVVS